MKRLIVLLALLLIIALPALAEDGDVVINEVMASNGMYENEHSYDWIEIHNRGKKTVDLSGWMLSDGKKNLAKFVFPKGTKLKAGGYVTIWCTGEDDVEPGTKSPYSATFSLKSEGETLYLSDADGERIQTLEYPQQYGNVSWGLPAGFAGIPAEADYGYLVNATRSAKNDAAVYPARTGSPALLTTGGFYPDGVTVQAIQPENTTLRQLNEDILPRFAKRLDCDGDYYDTFICMMERLAASCSLTPDRIRTDREFYEEVMALRTDDIPDKPDKVLDLFLVEA